MKRVILLATTFLFFVSCNGGGAGSPTGQTATNTAPVTTDPVVPVIPPTTPPVTDPTPVIPTDPIPTLAETFDTNITLVNFTSAQEAKYQQAIELVKKVVHSEAFKSKVLNFTYNGVKTFVDNGGYTNEEIYQKILEAAETLHPEKNNIMDLEVELYSNIFTSTVGYTSTNTSRIYVNTKYFNSYGPTSVANNLFHEWLHKIGFDHAVNYSVSRDSSVPYGIGNIVESLAGSL